MDLGGYSAEGKGLVACLATGRVFLVCTLSSVIPYKGRMCMCGEYRRVLLREFRRMTSIMIKLAYGAA
ncbi:hypothetical protein CC80DRAFT_490755 [Byssothecium circinans]|uniref:Uncharacterized protein n=1 Tax=Byssothecium circinans TaxID=147558 RepID=A0A6A5U7Y4_9PLEO|nr:hypothetical protein CC80DRAFT_490755 [Byssothecium circinans]